MADYPLGPPALWAMNARNDAVKRGADLQTRLNADPMYAKALLAQGQRPAYPEGEGQFLPSTIQLMRQQQNQGQWDTDQQRHIATMLQGLQQSYGYHG